MTIDRIELRVIEIELISPFRTSMGLELTHPCIIVSAFSNGLTGWGECVASQAVTAEWAFYSYETVETAWHILKDFLAPALVGKTLNSVEPLVEIGERLRGHPMARAGLEAAIWDLLAQSEGLPLADYLRAGQNYSQPRRDRVNVGVSVGIQSSVEETVSTVAGYIEQGYRRIKLKIEPGWDVDVARAVRREFPDIPLMLDANSAYSLKDAERLKQLDEFNLLMIEQPLAYDDIYEHAKLQAQLSTPICLDESIHTLKHAEWAYELEACRIINIKPGRVGGLYHGRAIHDLSLSRGKPVWIGGMMETGIGRAANVALASLPGVTLPGDISASNRYYRKDITEPPFVLNPDSTVSVPTAPGIGVTIDQRQLDEYTQRKAVVSSTG
ncbi:MAG: o-succinylbenzoate synthase [Anaerolineales bacterium]|nr:o-succinylbenzoate synthase [Anaerolineales bacterium]MBK9780231.1 o-succinylbenzoate synthase [Anaerolineales bacterium]